MSDPNELSARHEPGPESEQQVFTGRRFLFWPALAAVLVLHVVAVKWLLWGYGIATTPFHGFPKTLLFASSHLVGALVIRLAAQRFVGDRFEWKWSLGRGRAAVMTGELTLILVTMGLLTVAYSWPKVMVQVLNPHLWDLQLANLDRVLFFGVDPNQFLLTVFEGAPRLFGDLLDRYYGFFVFSQSVGAAWFLTDPRARMRVAFGLGFVVLWLAGTWCYVAVPALGPVYAFEDLPPRVAEVFPAAHRSQAALGANYAAVQSIASGEGALIEPHLGIAAMPSLHVGVHLLLYLWAVFSKSRLRPVLLGMTLLTFFGSVATCWHYAVDGIAGAILAAGAFGVSVVVARKLRRPKETSG